MAEKRRLPLLQPRSPEEEEAEARPPWHWSAIGAVAILLAWVPLAALGHLWRRAQYDRVAPGDDPESTRRALAALEPAERLWLNLVAVLPPLLALALAAFLGGLLVGRFGGRAGRREALVGGLSAAGVALLLVAPEMVRQPGGVANLLMAAVVVLTVAALASLGGAVVGLRRRRP